MLVLVLIVAPILIAPTILWFQPTLIFGASGLNVTSFWTTFNTILGYYGFLFSLYAALTIRKIQARYFERQWLPVIVSELGGNYRKLVDFRNKSPEEFSMDSFLESILANTKSVERLNLKRTWTLIWRVKKGCARISKQIANNELKSDRMVEVKSYLLLKQAVGDLHQELRTREMESNKR